MVTETVEIKIGDYVSVIATDFQPAMEAIGKSGLVTRIDPPSSPNTHVDPRECSYMVYVEGVGEFWYGYNSLDLLEGGTFSELTQEEKTIFIKNLVGQLYNTPNAYPQYKRLYQLVEQKKS